MKFAIILFAFFSIGLACSAEGAEVTVVNATLPQLKNSEIPVDPVGKPLISEVSVDVFIQNDSRIQQKFWVEGNNRLFNKRTIDWSSDDFLILERKIREQIDADYAYAVSWSVKYKTSIDGDNVYKMRKQALSNTLSLIPVFKQWIALPQLRSRALDAGYVSQKLPSTSTRNNIAPPIGNVDKFDFESKPEKVTTRFKKTSYGNLIFLYGTGIASFGAFLFLIYKFSSFVRSLFPTKNRCPECKSKKIKRVLSRGEHVEEVSKCLVCGYEWVG